MEQAACLLHQPLAADPWSSDRDRSSLEPVCAHTHLHEFQPPLSRRQHRQQQALPVEGQQERDQGQHHAAEQAGIGAEHHNLKRGGRSGGSGTELEPGSDASSC